MAFWQIFPSPRSALPYFVHATPKVSITAITLSKSHYWQRHRGTKWRMRRQLDLRPVSVGLLASRKPGFCWRRGALRCVSGASLPFSASCKQRRLFILHESLGFACLTSLLLSRLVRVPWCALVCTAASILFPTQWDKGCTELLQHHLRWLDNWLRTPVDRE